MYRVSVLVSVQQVTRGYIATYIQNNVLVNKQKREEDLNEVSITISAPPSSCRALEQCTVYEDPR